MPKPHGLQIQTLAPSVGFVLDDVTLARELELSAEDVEKEAKQMSRERLEEMNRAFDEYIHRQSRFKTEIVQEIAHLHENCAYAILGVSADATDEEIKRAYRLIAVLCHPDKGGDKEDFQELISAYERILEHRRSKNTKNNKNSPFDDNCDSDYDVFLHKKETNKKKPKKRAEDEKPKKRDEDEDKENNDDNDDSVEIEAEDLKERAERIAGGEKGAAEVNNVAEDLRTPEPAETEEHADANEEESFVSLIRAADKAAEEASLYAKTGAELSRQAAEAAETARRGREKGTRDVMTRSVAHSAIVLTLTVVKAVRVVGYATFDVSMQCRMAARRNQEALGCVESAAKTMHLGLQALNAALKCAKVTEATATELQTPAEEGDQKIVTASTDRFVNVAVEVSIAAQIASNAAVSAAIAAVAGSRACMKAMEKEQPSNNDEAQQDPIDLDDNKAIEDEESASASTELACKEPQPGDEEYVPKPSHRQIMQRKYNHKTFNQLNEDLLLHQKDVKEFLQENRQLIPQVSGDTKRKIFGILRDYATEARVELEAQLREISFSCPGDLNLLLSVIQKMPLLTPFLQPADVAIPASVKARVLKMAALCDMAEAMKLINSSVFDPALRVLPQESDAWKAMREMQAKIRVELDFDSVEAPIVATDGAATDTA